MRCIATIINANTNFKEKTDMKESFLNVNDLRFEGKSDSETISNALKEAENGDVRTVVIPRKNRRTKKDVWIIDKAILLPNDVCVLMDDCRLRLADGVYDNIFRNKNMYTETASTKEGEQHGIRIIGRGEAVLDGGEDNGLREQTWDGSDPAPRTGCLILLNNVREYCIENIACEQMRYWAIDQIACRYGRISNIRFDAKRHRPNQDGIDLRIGCYAITVENVTGYTGDDVVALSAFPCGGDAAFLPKGRSADIHGITVKNIRATTNQTLVALRNNDGAKIYDITIENVEDTGDGHEPWGCVRIGENNWYTKRPVRMGELYGITVRNVRARARGCVYVEGALSNSHISDIYAGGTTLYAVSSYRAEAFFDETNIVVEPGVSMENVVMENIFYYGSSEYTENPNDKYSELTFPNEKFAGCAIDFRCLRKDDKISNVVLKKVFTERGRVKALIKEDMKKYFTFEDAR